MPVSLDAWLKGQTTSRLLKTLASSRPRCRARSYRTTIAGRASLEGRSTTGLDTTQEPLSYTPFGWPAHEDNREYTPFERPADEPCTDDTDGQDRVLTHSGTTQSALKITRSLVPGSRMQYLAKGFGLPRYTIENLVDTLETVEQAEGRDGVIAVLRSLPEKDIIIPVAGPSAEKVWDMIFKYIICSPQETDPEKALATEFLFWARRLKIVLREHHPLLYNKIVGQQLHLAPEPVTFRNYSHAKLAHYNMCDWKDVMALIPSVLGSIHPRTAFVAWRKFYDHSQLDVSLEDLQHYIDPTHSFYARFEAFIITTAERRAHIAASDRPERELAESSAMLALEDSEDSVSAIQHHNFDHIAEDNAEAETSTQSRRAITNLGHGPHQLAAPRGQGGPVPIAGSAVNRQGLNKLVGNVHGIAEKNLSDDFCASMIATRLSTPRMSLSALRLLGVETLGMMSMQELVRRTDNLHDLRKILAEVSKQGFKLSDDIYVRLVCQIVEDHDAADFATLLAYDQHPENYNKIDLQRRLMRDAGHAKQWERFHLGTRVLELEHGLSIEKTLNNSLRYAILRRHFATAKQVLRDMDLNDAGVDNLSRLASTSLLVPRETGKHPVNNASAPVPQIFAIEFGLDLFKHSIKRGTRYEIGLLRELLKRQAMSGQLRQQQDFVRWYGQECLRLPLGAKRTWALSAYGTLIDDCKQQSLVRTAWDAAALAGRCVETYEKNDKDVTWSDGIRLLRESQVLGLPVDMAAIKAVIQEQLWRLFGPGHSDRRRNDQFIALNKLTMWAYILEIETIWPGLLGITAEMAARTSWMTNDALVALFGERRNAREKGVVSRIDVHQWANSFRGSPRPMPTTARVRSRRAWYSRNASSTV